MFTYKVTLEHHLIFSFGHNILIYILLHNIRYIKFFLLRNREKFEFKIETSCR